MRYFLLILMIVSLSSCFVFDKIPEVRVTIDKSLVPEVDSVFLIDNSEYFDLKERNSIKVSSEIKDYSFFTYSSNARIKLKLKNSMEYFSDSTIIEGSEGKIKISRFNNKIKFEKIVRTNFQKYAPLILIILLVIFVTKVPIAILIINPLSKFKFLLYYSGLNLIYLGIFILLMILNFEGFATLLYPFYLIVLGIDLLFLTICYKDKGILRPIIAGVVSNLLFLIIGQFIITFAVMIDI